MNDVIPFAEFNLVTLNQEQLEKIKDRLPLLHRASYIIGHSTSQTSYSLQTLQMMSDSPLSRLKQIISQMNKKYQALREAYFKMENMKIEIKALYKNTDEKSHLEIRDKESLINIVSASMENTLREIGMFQDMYDAIVKNNNIPENWSEKDFEKQEIEHMIRASFRLAIQDLSSGGRTSNACVEYWEQLGIHPQLGEMRTREYLISTQQKIVNGENITITLMYDFLDEMVGEFGESYKFALTRMGLDSIGSESFMASGETKPR
jgi:hypothetical protein